MLQRSTALLILVWLTACGFEPLYGEQSSADARWLSSVQLPEAEDRFAQLLHAAIEDAINPKGARAAPLFRLNPTIQTQEYPFATNLDGSVSRYVINIVSTYELVRIADNKVVASGHMKRTTSYNVSDDDDYATFIARQDAQERAMEGLAEQYRFKLRSYFHRYAEQRGA